MAQYGSVTYLNGKQILSPDGSGGVFVQMVVFDKYYRRYTFYDLAGMNIFGIVIKGGYHNVIYGLDGSGYPYVEAQGYTKPADWTYQTDADVETTVGIFAK